MDNMQSNNEEESKSNLNRDEAEEDSGEDSEANNFKIHDPNKRKIKGFENYNANLIDRGKGDMKRKIAQ